MGAGLGGAYLHPVPNLQPLDLVILSAGFLLGARDGLVIGSLTMLVYSLLNPYGAAHPLVTLSQVIGESGYVLGGGLLAALGLARWPLALRMAALGAAALPLTLFFDLITNLATGLLYGQQRVILLGGIPFALVHLAGNAVLFAGVGAPLAAVLARYRERLSS